MNEDLFPPFFIVGCARSGTTLLRDILRLHPNLNAPEETFFYRWGDPFGTKAYQNIYLNNATLKHHYKLDDLSYERVTSMMEKSHDRRNFNTRYARAVLKKAQNGTRWFDKTPQNIYGILLIHAQFPKSKIVHIYRNPLNVVASLKAGKVMPEQSLVAAINYWLEAMQIIEVYKRIPNNNLLELKYEDLLSSPKKMVSQLLIDLDETPDLFDFSKLVTPTDSSEQNQKNTIFIKPEENKYLEVLSTEEINYIVRHCGRYMKHYDYSA